MDSGFASTMLKEVENLEQGFEKFSSSTLTTGVWEGEAADNAKKQKDTKINKKIEKVKPKLSNLVKAIDLANEAIKKEEELKQVKERINEISSFNSGQKPENQIGFGSLFTEQEKLQSEINNLKTEIKSLCSE